MAASTFYDGSIRIVNSAGEVIADGLDPAEYPEYIGEKDEAWTYLKSRVLHAERLPGRHLPRGSVGPPECRRPLRNAARRSGAGGIPRVAAHGAVLSSFHYHYARLIEILYCVERMEQLLTDPEILSTHVRAIAGPNTSGRRGRCEAPRGTLFHHYKIDEHGLIRWANLIIATGQNNLAMNRGILQVAKHFVKGERLEPGMLNRVEALIRTYDPCLSCSTHAFGEMPLVAQLFNSSGELLHEARKAC